MSSKDTARIAAAKQLAKQTKIKYVKPEFNDKSFEEEECDLGHAISSVDDNGKITYEWFGIDIPANDEFIVDVSTTSIIKMYSKVKTDLGISIIVSKNYRP